MHGWNLLRESGVQCSTRMNILELAFFTFSLVTSILLSLIPSNRALARQNRGTSPLMTIISTISAVIALAVSLTSLVLAWLGLLSLEALSAVIFALIPALLAMPVDTLLHAHLRRSMSSYKSLGLTTPSFRYATIHEKRTSLDEIGSLATHPERSEDEIVLVIKHISTRTSKGLVKRKRNKSFPQIHLISLTNRQRLESQLRKAVCDGDITLERTANTVILQKEVFGSRDRWWISISSATWLMAKPSLVHLQTKQQVIQALALLSDIISIGRVALYFRRDLLIHHLENNRMLRRGLSGTISVVCNSLIHELGLDDWGSICPRLTLSKTDDPVQRPKDHGILFFILSGMSNVFGMKSKRYEGVASEIVLEPKGNGLSIWSSTKKDIVTRLSAQTILDNFRDEDLSPKEFKEFLATRIDDWLISWGCTIDKPERNPV